MIFQQIPGVIDRLSLGLAVCGNFRDPECSKRLSKFLSIYGTGNKYSPLMIGNQHQMSVSSAVRCLCEIVVPLRRVSSVQSLPSLRTFLWRPLRPCAASESLNRQRCHSAHTVAAAAVLDDPLTLSEATNGYGAQHIQVLPGASVVCFSVQCVILWF